MLIFPAVAIGLDALHWQQQIPVSVRLDKSDGVVTLRGIATYKQLTKEVYAGAFYSENTIATPKAALADKGAKRMLFLFLMPMDNFNALVEGNLRLNNSPEILLANQIDISQFLKILSCSFRAGDMVMFDYIPKVGTRITVNSSVEGVITGEDFYTFLLKTWMGRQPPSLKFQQDLFLKNAVMQN